MNKDSFKNRFSDFMLLLKYKLRFGRKFKNLNINEDFAEKLIFRSDMEEAQDIFQLIKHSKSPEEFSNNINDYLKNKKFNYFAPALLIGNITGNYSVVADFYTSLKDKNIESFSFENKDLLTKLKSHFFEYIINNNARKNIFAEQNQINNFIIKDLSQDIVEDNVVKAFDDVLSGKFTDSFKAKVILNYIIGTIGIYPREDIMNNFDFVLYDLDRTHTESLDERRNKYLAQSKLSNAQMRRVSEVDILRKRLNGLNGSEELISRLNSIDGKYEENIDELEDIYSEYEILYRQDIIDNLYIPKEEITIIEDIKDLKPQLIHSFLRSPEKFRKGHIAQIKQDIINERPNGDRTSELTSEEQERVNKIIHLLNSSLDTYKVNYTTKPMGTYSDALGYTAYKSDTTNQISASLLNEDNLADCTVGIIGIGFNGETLTPEAIAISSDSYKTTNKGLNNIEYNEEQEFKEISAPFVELKERGNKSEVVMYRRGINFDTKASYVLVAIDSSNTQQTEEIMAEVEEIKKKEGLKIVVIDVFKIRESNKQQEQLNNIEDCISR